MPGSTISRSPGRWTATCFSCGSPGRRCGSTDLSRPRPRMGRRGETTMERTYTIDELLAAVRRRWKTLALVAGGGLWPAALVIARLPHEYGAPRLSVGGA